MQLACIQMVTSFVSHVTPTPKAMAMFTLIKCPVMSKSKVQPNGCKSGTSQRKYVNSTGFIEMETYYASIISTMLESLKAAK